MSIGDLFDRTEVGEKKQEQGRREMDKVPDGTYNAEVIDFAVFSDAKDDYYVTWWFRVSDGAAQGAQLQSFSSVSDRSITFIKKSVKAVTGSFPTWGEMYDSDSGRTGRIRFDLVGAHVQVTQKTVSKGSKDYVNVYVDKRIDTPSVQPVSSVEDEVDVDDLF